MHFSCPVLGGGRTGRRLARHLRRCGRDRGPALADRAVEGRAFARHLRRGEAARGRAFADRARWNASRPNPASATAGRRISGSPRSSRRPRGRGARRSRATARRPGAARSRAKSPCAPIAPPRPSAAAGSVWPLRNTWNRATENLFSAWIEKLFDDPLDAAPSWPALHEVLRDRSRNFLFNHLGLGEDEMKMVLRPDCADLPYFLRAYFAFKMGLPFGFSKCTRGGGGKPPHCPQWFSIQNAETPPAAATALTAPSNRAERILRTGRACGTDRARGAARAEALRRLGLAAAFGEFLADRRRQRPFRFRADGGERQQHRLLSRVAQAGDAAPGDRVRRSVRAHSDDRAARAAVGRRGGRHSRGRWAARRDGRAQAVLARQFPVRPGSRARRAPDSSASGRSCSGRTASCGG